MEKDPLYEKVIEVEQLLLDIRTLVELLVASTQVCKDEWLDNQEIMQKLKISERTLKRRRQDGTFPFKKIKGKCYYRLSDIMLAFTQLPSGR